MAAVEFVDLTKHYGSVVALKNVNLAIEKGEFFTLLGPSGSGKTTLLNILSGMIMPTQGKIFIDGSDVTYKPPRQRGLGMVFQNYALMPHMTVFQNIAFPLRIRQIPRNEIERAVKSVLEIVRLEGFEKRKPEELSGGQQQRVSIARCLVYKPKLILMDEPLGALDKKLRVNLQLEIKKIHDDVGVTILYVTHDQEEALVLSKRICVMKDAQIEQVGYPNELYFNPRTEFVADFLGESNLIPTSVVSVKDGVAQVKMENDAMLIARTRAEYRAGSAVKLLIRPEAVRLASIENRNQFGIEGVVENQIFVGQSMKYWVRAGNLRIAVHLNSSSQNKIHHTGDRVWLDWSESDAILIERSA